MISGVKGTSVDKNNIFIQNKGNENYYLTLETAKDIYEKHEHNKEKNGVKVGIIIASSAIIAALGIFALTKGLPKNTYRKLQNLSNRLEDKVSRRKLNGEEGFITSFYNYSLKKAVLFAEKAKSINNISSFKDLFLTKIMFKSKYTKYIWTKITSLFENLAIRSVNLGYDVSDKNFSNLLDSYSAVNKKILKSYPDRLVTINNVTKTTKEWMSEVSSRQSKIKDIYVKGFGTEARNARYQRMKQAVEGLDEKVWEVMKQPVDGLKSKVLKNSASVADNQNSSKLYTSFIAEDYLAADKLEISQKTNVLRHLITHDVLDGYKASKQVLDNISAFISPQDKISNDLLKRLRSHLITYKKLSGPSEQILRSKVNADIIEDLKMLSSRLTDSSKIFDYKRDTVKQVGEYISELQEILSKNSKGELQEILTIYKSFLPKNEYVKIRKNTNAAISKLDKAINTENDLFFDKLRDLSLGSGPTDALSLLGAIGGVGLGLTEAENKDERISALLKYGIPVVGSVATSIVMTVSLVAGFKSLVIGSLSGLIIGDAGMRLDKLRKQYNKKKNDNNNAEMVKAKIDKTLA